MSRVPNKNLSKKVAKYAGGLPAVLSTLKQASQNTGLIRGMGILLKANKKNGFDCPGCAWPDPDDKRSVAEFCENGAKAILDEATQKHISEDFFQNWTIEELEQKTDKWLNDQGRITQPLLYRKEFNNYQITDWQTAYEIIKSNIQNLTDPNKAVFYTSGRASNEAAFLYQLFARQLGTNNLPDCSNMCHESSGVALKETIGIGKGTVTLSDFDKTDCILIVGQNPGSNHPRMLSALQSASRNGAKIIVVNPLIEPGLKAFCHPQEISGLLGKSTPLSTQYLQVRVGGDQALLKGVIKSLVTRKDYIDRKFIEAKTIGYSEFLNGVDAVSWGEIESESGVSKIEIKSIADTIADSKELISCWAMGITQHKNAVDIIQEIVNIHLLGGRLGRVGSGLCPVRGHSNVQGDRTVGIWEKPSIELLNSIKKVFQFNPPLEHGYDSVSALKAMYQDNVELFISLGGNLIAAGPDTRGSFESLKKVNLSVHISTKFNRSHLAVGNSSLILPCLGRTELDRTGGKYQFVTVENSMGIVHRSQGTFEPASDHLKSEVEIVAKLGDIIFSDKPVNWKSFISDYKLIRDLIEKTIPGFDNYDERICKLGQFYLPNSVRDKCTFETKTKKAHFTRNDLKSIDLKDNEYLMTTIRTHDQFNTTVYSENDRYRGIYQGRRIVLINSKDMVRSNYKDGDLVNLISEYNGVKRVSYNYKLVAYNIPSRCVATYFPEANEIVPIEVVASKSHTPISKSVLIRIQKVDQM